MQPGQTVIRDHRRALIAVYLDTGSQARIRASSAGECSERTVGEAQDSYRNILRVHAMRQCLSVGVDRTYRPHQPLQQINRVDALVHQDAATIQLPGAAPRPAVVILLTAPPGNLRAAQYQPAKRALLC